MLSFLPARHIGADGMAYRPDEEIPEGVFRMQDARPEFTHENDSDSDTRPSARLTLRETILYGFLAGVLGAAIAAFAGQVVPFAWPAGITTVSGALIASLGGWFALGRRSRTKGKS